MSEPVTLPDTAVLPASNLWWIDLCYTLLWSTLLLWASSTPNTLWFNGGAPASYASQVMAACAILTPLIIPFVVYFPLAQATGHRNYLPSLQLSLAKTIRGYLKQVVICYLLSSVPLLSVYVLFVLMSRFGFLANDFLTPILLGRSFVIFVASVTLLTSTLSIGLAASGLRTLQLVATAIAVAAVTLPFILSGLVTGTRFENHLIRFVQALEGFPGVSIVLWVASLLAASFFCWLFGRRQQLRQQERTEANL